MPGRFSGWGAGEDEGAGAGAMAGFELLDDSASLVMAPADAKPDADAMLASAGPTPGSVLGVAALLVGGDGFEGLAPAPALSAEIDPPGPLLMGAVAVMPAGGELEIPAVA